MIVDEKDRIRSWVIAGNHGGLLGSFIHEYYGNKGTRCAVFWIGLPNMVGVHHPDGSRMAINISHFSTNPEVTQAFNERLIESGLAKKRLNLKNRPGEEPAKKTKLKIGKKPGLSLKPKAEPPKGLQLKPKGSGDAYLDGIMEGVTSDGTTIIVIPPKGLQLKGKPKGLQLKQKAGLQLKRKK